MSNNTQQPEDFDPLVAYANWASRNIPVPPLCPLRAITRVGKFSGLTLHRQGRFQSQLWICDPGSEIPNHGHPNVDSIQVYVAGQLDLSVGGQKVMERDTQTNARGIFIRIGPGVKHGATIGPEGACFLTFQEWLKGEPESVETDWDGPALSNEHAKFLNDAAVLAGIDEVGLIKK
jgi:quercetin dioxygenase-like cupin family protein